MSRRTRWIPFLMAALALVVVTPPVGVHSGADIFARLAAGTRSVEEWAHDEGRRSADVVDRFVLRLLEPGDPEQ